MSEQRALLTDTERKILSGEKDVKDNYRYSVESRVRTRLRNRLTNDVDLLQENQPDLYEILRDTVCEDDIAESGSSADVAESVEADASRDVEAKEEIYTDLQDESALRDALADVEFPGTKDREACVAAVRAAYEYLQENETATMREFVGEVMPEHPLGYDVPDLKPGERYRGAWWRKVVKPGLNALDDVESPPTGGSDWTYTGGFDE